MVDDGAAGARQHGAIRRAGGLSDRSGSYKAWVIVQLPFGAWGCHCMHRILCKACGSFGRRLQGTVMSRPLLQANEGKQAM